MRSEYILAFMLGMLMVFIIRTSQRLTHIIELLEAMS